MSALRLAYAFQQICYIHPRLRPVYQCKRHSTPQLTIFEITASVQESSEDVTEKYLEFLSAIAREIAHNPYNWGNIKLIADELWGKETLTLTYKEVAELLQRQKIG